MPHKKAKKSLRDAATKSVGYDNPPALNESVASSSHNEDNSTSGVGVWAPKEKEEGKMKRRLSEKTGKKIKVDSFGGRNDLGGLSKSIHRVLNAGAVREEYNANRKRKREEEEHGGPKGKNKAKKAKPTTLTPLPYESLSAFNRRVEIALRPSIDSAIKASKSTSNSSKKAKAAALAKLAAASAETSEDATIDSSKSKSKTSAGIDPHIPPPKKQTQTEFAVASQRKSITDVVMAPPELKTGGRRSNKPSDVVPSSRLPVSDEVKRVLEMERVKAVRLYREMKEARASAGKD